MSYCLFFFKQKTAYEMRMSDWSSDVCSSDLRLAERGDAQRLERIEIGGAVYIGQQPGLHGRIIAHRRSSCGGGSPGAPPLSVFLACQAAGGGKPASAPPPLRSEEHTSELQSLMRISYAVFCLKKKRKKKQLL